VTTPAAIAAPLGPRQFLVVASGLVVVGLAVGYLLLPSAWEEYYAQVKMPPFQPRYGFESKLVVVQTQGGRPYRLFVITSVVSGGPFAMAGFRSGDVPITHHGGGLYQLEWALRKADEGVSEEVKVASLQDIIAQNWDVRRIKVPILAQR